jgi:hypothetical protein
LLLISSDLALLHRKDGFHETEKGSRLTFIVKKITCYYSAICRKRLVSFR